jgi:4-hydroxybenzoate polyprenyltransferase
MADSIWIATLRLSCPQWYTFNVTPFLVGYLAGGHIEPLALLLSTAMWLLGSAITDIANRIADREQDRIDYPLRTRLFERVGLRRLWWVLGGLVVTFFATFAVAAATYLSLAAITLGFVGIGMALGYSFGPRFKTRKLQGPLHYGAVSAISLLFGWVHHGSWIAIAPFVVVLWVFGMTLLGWKDIDNLLGDKSVGYRSIYLDIVEARSPAMAAQLAVSVPFVLTCGLVAARLLPVSALAILLLYPLGSIFAKLLVSADRLEERQGVRELGIWYWQLFMSAVLMVLVPAWRTVLLLGLSLVWWVLASYLLNCDPPGLTRRNLVAVQKLLWSRR